MGWRDVQAKINSGELSYAPSAMDTFFEAASSSFRKYYMKAMDDQADALAKTKEIEAENKKNLEAAARLSKEILGSDDKSAVNYVYGVLKDYEGNVGQATERLENLTEAERLKIVPAGSFAALNSSLDAETLDLFTTFESGQGGYDALLGQAQDNDTPFRDTKITEMTMDQVLEFASPGGDYANYSLTATVPGQQAHENSDPATPLGKFQFVGSTLRDIQNRGGFEQLGINGSTLFDEETQNKLFSWYVKDTMKASGGDKVTYRDKMRKRFEGFKKTDAEGNYLVSDEQLDNIYAKVTDGAFTNGKVSNVKAPKRFNLGERIGAITGRDEAALQELQNLKLEILTEGYDLEEGQPERIEQLETEIKAQIRENGYFKFDTFLEENRLTNKGTVTAAIAVVDAMEDSQFRNGDTEKAGHLEYLRQMYEDYDEAEQAENKQKSEQDRDPFVFYRRNENGVLDLGGMLVKYRDGKYYDLTQPNVEVDVTQGKLTAQDYDAGTFIKIYNDNILKMGEIVSDGESATDVLLRYRQLAYENPAAFNSVVNATAGLINFTDETLRGFNTLINEGRSFEEVLGKYELTQAYRGLSDPAKKMFSFQLQSAYALARLNGSSGQGLSDRELEQNLEAVGFGVGRADIALGLINEAVKTVEGRTNTRRKGIINALIGNSDYIDAIKGMPISKDFGKYMQGVVGEEGYDPVLKEQYEFAKSGSVEYVEIDTTEDEANLPTLDRTPASVEAWNNAPSGTKFKVQNADGSFTIKTKP
jgi:hypothetical protein